VAVGARLLAEPRADLGAEGDVPPRGGAGDPTSVVARSERPVSWSRLGHYDAAALDRALYPDGELFEHWAMRSAGACLAAAVADLARWPGAREIVLGDRRPAMRAAALDGR